MSRPSFLNRSQKYSRYAGFSLMEILVVIAVIAIIGLILIPIIRNVRESANRAECTSNLRQIGMVMQLYMQENNGWTPPAVYSYSGNHYWIAWREPLEDYVDIDSDLFFCPSGLDHLGKYSSKARYRMQPRSSSASPQAWHPILAPGRPYNPDRPSTPDNVVMLLDTFPHYHGIDKSPLLFFDGSVRLGQWQNYFNDYSGG